MTKTTTTKLQTVNRKQKTFCCSRWNWPGQARPGPDLGLGLAKTRRSRAKKPVIDLRKISYDANAHTLTHMHTNTHMDVSVWAGNSKNFQWSPCQATQIGILLFGFDHRQHKQQQQQQQTTKTSYSSASVNLQQGLMQMRRCKFRCNLSCSSCSWDWQELKRSMSYVII